MFDVWIGIDELEGTLLVEEFREPAQEEDPKVGKPLLVTKANVVGYVGTR